MKHQDLLHVHGLLAEVATYLTEQGKVTVDVSEYRALGTGPMSVDHAKAAHEDAIAALAAAVADGLKTDTNGAIEADEAAEGEQTTSPTPG